VGKYDGGDYLPSSMFRIRPINKLLEKVVTQAADSLYDSTYSRWPVFQQFVK
jgi:hypothetical protein